MSILILFCLWSLWCTLHSALISVRVNRFFNKHLKSVVHWYRLVFNGFSGITFLALAIHTITLESHPLVTWNGFWPATLLRAALLAAAGALTYAGANGYNTRQFLGIEQIRKRSSSLSLTATGELNLSGIHGWVRHPWYLATLLFVWSWWWELRPSFLVVNGLLTAYVIIGTHLEEKKLVLAYGKTYEIYQQQVPMLIPRKPSGKKSTP